jgi:hypothetical protein
MKSPPVCFKSIGKSLSALDMVRFLTLIMLIIFFTRLRPLPKPIYLSTPKFTPLYTNQQMALLERIFIENYYAD